MKPEHDYEKYYAVKPGDTVVDVGAGPKGKFIQSISGVPSRIIAIEPESRGVRNLRRLKEKFTLVEKGAWDERGWVKMNVQPGGGFRNSIVYDKAGDVELSDVEEVEVDTLDNIFDKFDLSIVDFLKIDVEGAEIEVIGGSTLGIVENTVVASYHKRGGKNTVKEVERLLGERGFETEVYESPPGKPLVYGGKE